MHQGKSQNRLPQKELKYCINSKGKCTYKPNQTHSGICQLCMGFLSQKRHTSSANGSARGEGVLDLSATNINARKTFTPCLADSSG